MGERISHIDARDMEDTPFGKGGLEYPDPMVMEQGEEEAWREHWQFIIKNSECFSIALIGYARHCLKVT